MAILSGGRGCPHPRPARMSLTGFPCLFLVNKINFRKCNGCNGIYLTRYCDGCNVRYVDLNIRDFDEELATALKVEAAKAGKTLKDLVTEKLKGAMNGSDAQSGSEIAGEGTSPSASMADNPGGGAGRDKLQHLQPGSSNKRPEAGEAETESRMSDCPDCGDGLVWNKILKKWVCECGYQGRATR